MNTGSVIQSMIDFYKGNTHDINHFLKVYAYAKTIGEQEQVNEDLQTNLEIAAIVHDIACPLCREKYGNTNGKMQEREGELLARQLLTELGCEDALINRVCYLVAHHHTYTDIDGMDYQILLEADYLVNADESNRPKESIISVKEKIFKTKTGLHLLDSIYLRQE